MLDIVENATPDSGSDGLYAQHQPLIGKVEDKEIIENTVEAFRRVDPEAITDISDEQLQLLAKIAFRTIGTAVIMDTALKLVDKNKERSVVSIFTVGEEIASASGIRLQVQSLNSDTNSLTASVVATDEASIVSIGEELEFTPVDEFAVLDDFRLQEKSSRLLINADNAADKFIISLR